jgi:signal transduction histidine kinase
LVAITLSFLSLIGYAFGAIRSFAFISGTNMALFTAVTMLVTSVGIVFTRVGRGLPALMTDAGAAGSVTRRLVPAAVLVPFLLGWALVYGERMSMFHVSVGISVYVILNVAVFLWLVRWAARIARETDQVREEMLSREQAAREAAETANLSKSNFLAVMSHELRTPLSAVIGYEELLVDEIAGPVNEAQRHQLGRIKASAQHLLDLIDQILSYSRIDAGREELHLEPSSANALADDASNLVEPLARANGLALVIAPSEADVTLRTDPSKVRQILVNLLSNAVKFTPDGTVTLRVSPNGQYVHYIVRDTGIGIAPEHLERIFDAFWQVERPSTRRIGGTGLGLSVTRRLVRLLGGDVFVESEVGHGTAFTVMLPLESPPSVVGLDPNIP